MSDSDLSLLLYRVSAAAGAGRRLLCRQHVDNTISRTENLLVQTSSPPPLPPPAPSHPPPTHPPTHTHTHTHTASTSFASGLSKSCSSRPRRRRRRRRRRRSSAKKRYKFIAVGGSARAATPPNATKGDAGDNLAAVTSRSEHTHTHTHRHAHTQKKIPNEGNQIKTGHAKLGRKRSWCKNKKMKKKKQKS